MASEAQLPRQFGFFSGTAGQTTISFTVTLKKDDVDITPSDLGFQIVDLSGGYYYSEYTPKQAGFYVLIIEGGTDSINVIDVVDIEEANYVNLTQDTPTIGHLKPTLPHTFSAAQFAELNEYLLMVILSSDWDVGRKTPHYAQAMTELDIDGNWKTTPLVIVPGTYHVVIRNNAGVERVIAANLEV